jgi:hypothetical protein
LSILATTERFSGFATVTETENGAENPTGTEDWEEAGRKLRERMQARDGNLLRGDFGFEEWVGSFLENYSSPPIRAAKTHEEKLRRATYLKAASSGRKLVDITADAIEDYRHRRLRQRGRVRLGLPVKPRNVGQPRITIA